MYLKYISRVFIFCFLFLTPAAIADVLYDNPVESEYGWDLRETSFQELLRDASQTQNRQEALKAQYLLGLSYVNGSPSIGVERDVCKGIEYLVDAWESGAADAGYALGSLYYKGVGVERDAEQALYYFSESAEMGYLLSQRALGKAYLGGYEEWEGLVDQDVGEAIPWLEKAANSGDLRSASALASIYAKGELVGRDFTEAFYWAKKWAASQYGTDPNAYDWLSGYSKLIA